MTSINKRIGGDEKVLKAFRTARRAHIDEYSVFFITVVIALAGLYYRLLSILNDRREFSTTFLWVFIIFLLISIAIFLKIEYKYWYRRYALTNKRLICSTGLFSEDFKSIIYDQITDMDLTQSFLDKILDTGTIKITTKDQTTKTLELENISRPFDIKQMINDIQAYNAMRQTRKIMSQTTIQKTPNHNLRANPNNTLQKR